MTAAEAAKLLQLNVKQVQAMARAGRLPAHRVGRKWIFQREEIEGLLGARPAPGASGLDDLSARNRLRGRITSLTKDGLMAEVRLSIGDQELVAMITSSSADRLGLRVGDTAFAVIKSTEIMIGRETRK